MKLRTSFLSLGMILGLTVACGDDTSGGGGTGGTPSTGGGDDGGAPQGGSPQGGAPQGGSPQGGAPQGGSPDGGAPQGGSPDGGAPQGGSPDGGAPQGGAPQGGNGGEGGAGGSPSQSASEQIAAVIAAADGAVSLPISGAIVTYEKPLLGSDPHGFFLQAEAVGPALFVAVDPATISADVGDELSLTVTDVTTVDGQKRATTITGASVLSMANPVDPLVTDINNAADVVTNLDGYTSRVVTFDALIDANFVNASNPHVAAQISTTALDDPNLRLRMPESVRAAFDLEANCLVTIDYGVVWRFNGVAQPSVTDASEIIDAICDDPVVSSAAATSNTSVVVTFSRDIDPASVAVADFTFNNGLTAQSVTVTGPDQVTITTSAQTGGTMYTVTVNSVDDVLGVPVASPDNTAMFQSFVVVAQMVINEISPNIPMGRDLVEFRVITAGSTGGVTFVEDGSNLVTLATFPAVNVAAGDLIVLHLNPVGTTGIAAASETASKNEFANATFSANYDNAWDFLGTGTAGLTFSHRVLYLRAPGDITIDALPVVLSSVASPPAAFPGDLQTLQAAAGWLPADCGGMLCTYVSTPTAVAISVDYLGAGTTPGGNSIQRKLGLDTMQNSDWFAAAAQTFGAANPAP